MDLYTILVSAAGGVTYALFRLWDERNKAGTSWEGFSLKKFGRSVIIGAGIGAVAPLTGLPLESVFGYVVGLPAYGGLVLAVETALKRGYLWVQSRLQ